MLLTSDGQCCFTKILASVEGWTKKKMVAISRSLLFGNLWRGQGPAVDVLADDDEFLPIFCVRALSVILLSCLSCITVIHAIDRAIVSILCS